MIPTILVIEDSLPILKYTECFLKDSGFYVLTADSGEKALQILKNDSVDLTLLDLGLNDLNGFEVLKFLRRNDEEHPVIIVSSESTVEWKVKGFEMGCSDYITKPYHPDELVARIKSQLKKRKLQDNPVGTETIERGLFRVDLKKGMVYKKGKEIEMRKKIFDIFLYFFQSPDQIITKQLLHDRFWDFTSEINDNTITVHIHELRQCIEENPNNPRHLITVRGSGYRFTA